MSSRLNGTKVGLVLSAVLGGYHLLWSLLVVAGWAQPVIDFVFWAHFIKPPYVVEPFELIRAVALLAMTSGVGFAIGVGAAAVWNALCKA